MSRESTEVQSYFSEDSNKFKTIGKKKLKTLKKRTTDKMSSGRKIPQDQDQNKKLEHFFSKKNVQRGRWDFRPLGRVVNIENSFFAKLLL